MHHNPHCGQHSGTKLTSVLMCLCGAALCNFTIIPGLMSTNGGILLIFVSEIAHVHLYSFLHSYIQHLVQLMPTCCEVMYL